MEKVSLPSGSQYQKEFQTFKDSKLYQRLNEKFRIKPYYEQNRHLKISALVSSYLFNFFSILTSFFFVYSLLNSFIGVVLGLVLSISMLIVLECFKRLILPEIAKNYLQFKKINFVRLSVMVVLVTLSGFFSASGGNIAVREFTTEVQTIDTDSIRDYYSNLIGTKQVQQNELLNVKYKGNTTRTAQKVINGLQTEINTIRSQENKLFSYSLEENEKLITNDSLVKDQNGLYFSLLALIFDLFLIFCIAYSEYYDYRSIAEFSKLCNDNDDDTAAVHPLGGGVKKLKNNEVVNDSKTIATAKKNCLNCEAVFDVSNPKKVFCSTKCRVKHWNSNHEKELTVPTI